MEAPEAKDVKKEENRVEADIKCAGRTVWLLKLPTEIADVWEKTELGSTLGEFEITPGASKHVFKFDASILGNNSTLPKEYEITTTKAKSNSYLFTQPDPESNVSWLGIVEQRGDLALPKSTSDALARERTLSANKRGRSIVMLDKNAKPKTTTTLISGSAREEAVSERLREKMPKEQIIALLCKLFEQQPFWSMKDLQTRTDQPQAWLKEALSQICIHHRSGQYKSLFQLKPEYQTYKPQLPADQ